MVQPFGIRCASPDGRAGAAADGRAGAAAVDGVAGGAELSIATGATFSDEQAVKHAPRRSVSGQSDEEARRCIRGLSCSEVLSCIDLSTAGRSRVMQKVLADARPTEPIHLPSHGIGR